jgi:hypothetical protein
MRQAEWVPVFLLCACTASAVRSAEPVPQPQAGEERVTGEEAKQALAELKVFFTRNSCVRGRQLTIVEDEASGPRKVPGDFVLQVPERFMRRSFGKDGEVSSVWLLDGAVVKEASKIQNTTVNAKDFSQAPKKLALLKAALTIDADVLKECFSLTLFRKPGAGGGQPQLRLVLMPLEGMANPTEYSLVEARWGSGAPFLSEIRTVSKKDKGDSSTRQFSDMHVVDRLADSDFKSPLLENKEIKTDFIKD